jgi:hypothetical protein
MGGTKPSWQQDQWAAGQKPEDLSARKRFAKHNRPVVARPKQIENAL